uniref:Uncharacterized protein n=1 Tax=Lactuca sativa TaxID=4236 RepID=A0A9R1VHA8_LACSA|nr:hypothetical protein LSAT_V11C500264840 [Lactuca sativa]
MEIGKEESTVFNWRLDMIKFKIFYYGFFWYNGSIRIHWLDKLHKEFLVGGFIPKFRNQPQFHLCFALELEILDIWSLTVVIDKMLLVCFYSGTDIIYSNFAPFVLNDISSFSASSVVTVYGGNFRVVTKTRKQSEHTTVINNKDISINNDMESNISKSKQSRTKFTLDFYSRKPPNDDDDFVNPQPVTIPIQKIVKKQTRMANPGKVEDSLRYLNTRFPPEHITKTMALLNNDQRKCVESIGFGSALNIQLEKLPRRICYWVVDNYDPNTNSIRVKDKRLVVTRERVHDIYGIPMGDMPMSNPCRANSRNKFVKLWKS